jgi:predicted dehydrogenase/threonine dehydrogenase-like Zn-dependent dehydrogenase
MRQVLLNSRGALVARVPRPSIEPGAALVRTRFSLVSVGTEVASLRPAARETPAGTLDVARERAVRARMYLSAAWHDPRRAARKAASLARQSMRRTLPPSATAAGGAAPATDLDDQGWNVGYSLSGEVVAVGEGVTDLGPGDLVACAGAGQANHADYVSVRRNLVCRVPNGCSLEAAAFGTVGAIALQGVRRASPQLGEKVCVLGLGLIGQIAVRLLRAAGCRVIGMDLSARRVERARGAGMDAGAADPESLKRLVRDSTAGHGADFTVITAASKGSAIVNLAMETTRRRGAVVIVGDVGLDVRRDEFYRKEIDLRMSTSYGPGRYDRAYEVEGRDYPFAHVRWTLNRNIEAILELAASGRIDLASLIDRIVPVYDAPAAYRELAEASEPPLGVLLSYPDDGPGDVPESTEPTRVTIRGHRAAPEGPVHYALVGAGAFGTSMLVPQMDAQRDAFFLRAVVSRNATLAGNFVRANRVEVLTSSLDDVLKDPGVGLLVIATRHHEHGRQVVAGLRAGKHVFVEKPLALAWEELDEVVAAYEEAPGRPLLAVGFNRRFSPALQRIAEELANRHAPVVINYRVNAGFIPPDHWVHGSEGGGRNLGEACHMYDAFRMLAGAPVVDVSAHALGAAAPYQRNDNFCATLKYADGTVATLTYTASGPRAMAKERIEVFCGGEAFVVDDFKRLERAGDGVVLWSAADADKGHREEIARLAAAMRGGPAPIEFAELVETTAVALQVEDLLFGRADATGDPPSE